MSIKSEARRLLEEYDREALIDLVLEDRRLIPALNRLIFSEDELIRWRAVEALGWVAREDPYLLEKIIGRLIYTMNDDSGSIGWMAPQALGEICANDPDLVEDFFPIVLSSMDLRVFRPGVIWAAGRVARVRPDLVEDAVDRIVVHLSDRSPEVRGLAAWALGRIGSSRVRDELRLLVDDPGRLNFYDQGRLIEKTVGRLAAEALENL